MCGEDHPDDPAYFRVVGMEHLTETDTSLLQVFGLEVDEEAERHAPGGRWVRSRFA